MTSLHIIGVGNAFRGDDGVGARVIDRLLERAADAMPHGVRLTKSTGDIAELVQAFGACREAVLIDAVNSSDTLASGAVIRMNLLTQEVPVERLRASSHCLGVAESIALARVLDCLPSKLSLWGIAARNFSLGDRLSPEVATAANTLTDILWRDYLSGHPAETASV